MNFLFISIFTVSMLLLLVVKFYLQNRKYEAKYSKIIDTDKELEMINKELSTLEELFKIKKAAYDDLVNHIAVYDQELELAEWGFYEPMFNANASEKYKNKKIGRAHV